MTRLLLVRHGQSEMNASQRLQGWLDSPLDELGRDQARALAGRIEAERPVALYTSTLRRARETADMIAERVQLTATPDERLKERDLGAFSGLSHQEIEERFPGTLERWRSQQRMVAAPEGEQPSAFTARVTEAFAEIVHRHPDDVVAVVTHGGVLATYLGHLLRMEVGRWAPFSFGNGSLTIVELNDGRLRVYLVNDRCHLDRRE